MSIYQLERDGDIEALSEALVGSESAAVRRQAARALGDQDPPQDRSSGAYESMLSALRTAVVDDDDELVRTASVTAIESHGLDQVKRLVRTITEEPLDRIGPETYARLLKSDRPEVRMVGLAAVGLDGTPAHGDIVLRAFNDPDERVRERAIAATMHLGLGRAENQLLSALGDEVPAVRSAAATAIGELNLTSAVSALAAVTKDDVESVRLAALDALAGLGSPAAIEPLANALSSSVPSVNRLAVYGLLELLTNASGEASHHIRERVQAIAEEAPRSSVVGTLIELLDAMDGTLQRRNAIWLLGRLIGHPPGEEAVDALVTHVGDDDDQTAKLATSALVRCKGPVVERRIRDRLTEIDSSDPETGQLAYVLGRVGTSRSIDDLETILEHTEDETVRRRVMSSLQRLEATGGV